MHNEHIDLAAAELHAPVEVTLAVYMQLPDGKIGTMRATMPPGQLPSRGELNLVLGSFTDEDGHIPGAPKGARLLSRSEFVSHITKRETGAPFQMPTDAQFSPMPSDIPHGMLVHAILGTGLPLRDGEEYLERGLVYYCHRDGYLWSKEKLVELPDAMLMAIYQRVGAA